MIRGQEREQKLLVDSIIEVGGIAEDALALLERALKDRNDERTKDVAEYSDEIKARSRECEREALKIILLHHPVARDLRLITAAIRMSNDLERIGDNAGDIGEILPFFKNLSLAQQSGLIDMATEVKKMVQNAVDALLEGSEEKAEEVVENDDVVDNLFLKAKNNMVEVIRENAPDADEAPDILMVAKYFERMGDHAVSFASYVGWMISGSDKWLSE